MAELLSISHALLVLKQACPRRAPLHPAIIIARSGVNFELGPLNIAREEMRADRLEGQRRLACPALWGMFVKHMRGL